MSISYQSRGKPLEEKSIFSIRAEGSLLKSIKYQSREMPFNEQWVSQQREAS